MLVSYKGNYSVHVISWVSDGYRKQTLENGQVMLAEFIMLLEKYTVGGAISDNCLVQKETIFKT